VTGGVGRSVKTRGKTEKNGKRGGRKKKVHLLKRSLYWIGRGGEAEPGQHHSCEEIHVTLKGSLLSLTRGENSSHPASATVVSLDDSGVRRVREVKGSS